MPQNFIESGRERAFLLPPSVRDWLPEDHLAWFVIAVVDQLDLAAFYAAYRADGHGRAAYDPSVMGWIQLVVATLDVKELRCREEAVLLDRAAAAGKRGSGRPPAGRREHRVRFWEAIARGASSENAAVEAGVLASIGVRWFRKGGGMPPLTLAPVSGRYLSFTEREEIAVLLARGCGVREIARQLGRAPSTISRELQRNAALRTGRPEYRASTAQTHADRRARRPKPAKLAVNPELRRYVQDRLSGAVRRPDGSVAGPLVGWRGRRHGPRKDRRWGTCVESGADLRSAACLTSPMMSRCVFLMSRSISRCMCRAAERCAGS